jgi:Transposase DDE domain group 1
MPRHTRTCDPMNESSLAYVLLQAVRRLGLRGTELAHAQASTLRLKLLKIGAQIRVHGAPSLGSDGHQLCPPTLVRSRLPTTTLLTSEQDQLSTKPGKQASGQRELCQKLVFAPPKTALASSFQPCATALFYRRAS